MTIKFWKGQVCAKLHCPGSAVTMFSNDGEKRGNPLLDHRKPKGPS